MKLDLVGLTEVAEILGVSKQRVYQLKEAGRMPEPVAVIRAGAIWMRADICAFASARNTSKKAIT